MTPPKMPRVVDLQHGHTSPLLGPHVRPRKRAATPERTKFDELMDAARAMIAQPDPLRGNPVGRTAEAAEALLVLAAQHEVAS